MSSLLTLDEYSLHRILFYLGGAEILQLVLCGAQNLRLKVLACPLLSFTWYGPGRSRWPSLISSFTRLEHLKYANAEDVEALPCGGLEIAHLPRTLKSFELRYFDPISPLLSATVTPDSRLSYSALALTTHLPLLETLNIQTSLELPSEVLACLTSIPLTRLKVKCAGISWTPLQWPDTLKHLSLYSPKLSTDLEKWVFPPHLETLFLSLPMSSPHWISNLPQSLSELHFTDRTPRASHMSEFWPKFPRALKSLFLLTVSEELNISLFKQLPQTLETLEMAIDLDEPNVVGGNTPEKIDEIWRPYDTLVEDMLAACPPSLTNLNIMNSKIGVKHLLKFPVGTKRLVLCDPGPSTKSSAFWSSLVRFSSLTLLNLTYGILEAPKTLTLPTSITELWLVELTDEISSCLPPLLKLVARTGSLSEHGTSCLPRTITHLEVTEKHIPKTSHFPPNLSTLYVDNSVVGNEDEDSSDSPKIYDLADPMTVLLPKTIKTLRFFPSIAITASWLRTLSEILPQLEHLTLYHFEGYSEELIPELPRNLRSLRICIFNLSVAGLKALPRTLTSINTEVHRPKVQTTLSNEDLIHVPRGAYSLLIASSPLLTEQCCLFLPQSLYRFQLGFQPCQWFENSFDPLAEYREDE